jgi:prepilin-type N-terminal cleavage/methylation domain-containing protein
MAKNNKGFSLVEVIIAVAVFAILIGPLTAQLINAVNINRTSVKKQYAIEKAEEIMESFKSADISGNVVIPDGNSTGDYTFTLVKKDKATKTGLTDLGSVDYTVRTYECNGISLGEQYEKYNCTVTVSDLPYAVASQGYVWDADTQNVKKNGSSVVKTTASTGTIRNLDNSQSAIITSATYLGTGSSVSDNSLDTKAYEYFRDAKLNILQTMDVYYSQYLSGVDYLSSDSFDKLTTIKVSKTTSGYRVQCLVQYTDKPDLAAFNGKYNSVYKPETDYGNGVVYDQEYTSDKVPAIYLFYKPAVCNGEYVGTDNLSVDTSGLSDSDKVNIYIFETAADASELSDIYKQVIQDKLGVSDVESLIYSDSSHALTQNTVNVRMNPEAGSKGTVDVYTNFNMDIANSNVNKDSSNITVKNLSGDSNEDVYLYDIEVTLTTVGNNDKTTVSGTRGR